MLECLEIDISDLDRGDELGELEEPSCCDEPMPLKGNVFTCACGATVTVDDDNAIVAVVFP